MSDFFCSRQNGIVASRTVISPCLCVYASLNVSERPVRNYTFISRTHEILFYSPHAFSSTYHEWAFMRNCEKGDFKATEINGTICEIL